MGKLTALFQPFSLIFGVLLPRGGSERKGDKMEKKK